MTRSDQLVAVRVDDRGELAVDVETLEDRLDGVADRDGSDPELPRDRRRGHSLRQAAKNVLLPFSQGDWLPSGRCHRPQRIASSRLLLEFLLQRRRTFLPLA